MGWGKDSKGSWGSSAWSGGKKGSWGGTGSGKGSWSGGASSWAGGKGYGGGKNKANHNEWGDEEQAWHAEEGSEQRTSRIISHYQFAKKIMRPAADADGSCFQKLLGGKHSDKRLLSRENLQKGLTSQSAHIVRRPAVGISECVGSWRAALDMIHENATDVFEEFSKLCHNDDLSMALNSLDTSTSEVTSENDFRQALQTTSKFISDNKTQLFEVARAAAIASARIYIGAMGVLQLNVEMSNPEEWAPQVPAANSEHRSLKKWKASPGDVAKMHSALARLLMEKVERDKDSSAGNSASAVLSRHVSHGDEDAHSDASSTGKAQKKAKKHKKASSSSSAPSSSSSDDKKKKKKKHGKGAKMKVDKENKKAEKKDKSIKKDSSDESGSPSRKRARKDDEQDKNKKDKSDKKDKSASASRSPSQKRERRQPASRQNELAATMTLMPQSKAQEMSALADTMVNEVGNKDDTVFPKKRLQELMNLVPQQIIDTDPELAAMAQEALAGDQISTLQAKKIIPKMQALARKLEKFWTSQQSTGGGSK